MMTTRIEAVWTRRLGPGLLLAAAIAFWPKPVAAQEPQGEIIGTIEGQQIAVKGPMSVQVVGNEVKTLLRSGVDIRVKAGRARIDLEGGGTIAVCGPAHISMLKAGNGLTVALDSGTIHARVEGNLALKIFTAQILAKTVAIGDGPQDVLVGFESSGSMCVRAGQGAVHLEEQFGGQTVLVPQGGDVTIANGQLQGLKSGSGQCACDPFEARNNNNAASSTELSVPAGTEEVKKAAGAERNAARNPASKPNANKPPAEEPTYQVFMPPLHYDANAKVQDDFDPSLIVLVRRARVRPTLIFESRVEGEAPHALPVSAPKSVNPAAKAESQPAKAKPAENASVVDRVKSFFKSLWTPSS